jgi:homogentisate 1,2-dioxygenase
MATLRSPISDLSVLYLHPSLASWLARGLTVSSPLAGANGLANPRDFLTPVAAYEDKDCEYTIVNKFGGRLWTCVQVRHHNADVDTRPITCVSNAHELLSSSQNNSPFDVVAWHGNYAPCKYDLSLFNAVNTVTYDHIVRLSVPFSFTVLVVIVVGQRPADLPIWDPHDFRTRRSSRC